LLQDSSEAIIDSLGIGVSQSASTFDVSHGERMREVSAENSEGEEIFGPCAASALYRARSLHDVGIFDSDFFAIFEDADLAFRLQISGWRSGLVRSARVYHKRGVSGRTPSGKRATFIDFLKLRNAVALKLRYWPSASVFCSQSFYRVIVKASGFSLLHGKPVQTSRLWARSLAIRFHQRSKRKKVFVEWADRTGRVATGAGTALPTSESSRGIH
jgi:GT2 family glycosyltransferase